MESLGLFDFALLQGLFLGGGFGPFACDALYLEPLAVVHFVVSFLGLVYGFCTGVHVRKLLCQPLLLLVFLQVESVTCLVSHVIFIKNVMTSLIVFFCWLCLLQSAHLPVLRCVMLINAMPRLWPLCYFLCSRIVRGCIRCDWPELVVPWAMACSLLMAVLHVDQ